MILKFTEYLHGDNDSYFRERLYEQLKEQYPEWDVDFEEWNQDFGRPFYEVKLNCEYDTETKQVKVIETIL